MKHWLFNPFARIAGWQSLLAGFAILLITAVPAFYGNVHLDGVLDLHIGEPAGFFTFVLEGLADWICMALFIYLGGLLFSRSAIRLLDVLGTQALARFPFFISCLASLLCFRSNMLHYLEYSFLHIGEAVEISAADVILFAVMLLVTLLMTIWNIILMYQAYSVACNVKGGKAVFSFIGCVLLAEVLSKLLISFI